MDNPCGRSKENERKEGTEEEAERERVVSMDASTPVHIYPGGATVPFPPQLLQSPSSFISRGEVSDENTCVRPELLTDRESDQAFLTNRITYSRMRAPTTEAISKPSMPPLVMPRRPNTQ